MAKSMIIDPNEIARKQNARQNCLDRVQGRITRGSVYVNKKKQAKKYACRKYSKKDWSTAHD